MKKGAATMERSRGEETEARAAVVLGALVADAASMGLHWLYDPDHLAMIAKRQDPTFLAADRQHFEDAKGYFAHEGKLSGELTQYGATLALAMNALVASEGRLDIADYQRRYLAFFGPGGDWKGYIDRPTRGTLAKLGTAVDEDTPRASGIDDDQMPAFSPVPAVVAAGPERPDLEQEVIGMVRVTNDNPLAMEAALILARTLRAVLQGEETAAVLTREAEAAGDELKPLLREALAASDRNSTDIAGHFGRACHVQEGLPVVFHILRGAKSYESAVRANILAGGDTCGRAMALGSILCARFGLGGERGMPLAWLTRLAGGAPLLDQTYRLAAC
ncbi:MAG: ADP-ribosylglycohydrolase family protein [Geminicoccaceae bacterium]